MELSNEFDVSVPIEQAWAVLTDIERIAPCLPGAQLQEVEGDEYRGIVKIKVGPIAAQYKGTARLIEKDDTAHRAVLSASGHDTRGQGNASASITAELTPKGDQTHVSVLTDLTITGKVAQFGRGVIGDVSIKLLDQFVVNLESTVLADFAGDGAAATTDDPGAAESAADAEVVDAAAEAAATGNADGEVVADDPDGASPEPEETAEMLASGLAKVWQSDTAGEGAESIRAERPSLRPRPDLLVAEQDVAEPAPAATSSNGSGARRIDSPEVEPIDLLDTAGSSVLKRALPLVAAVLGAIVVLGVLRRARRRRR